ncbi:MAG: (d)CMP kinase [Clostridiales bacterium]|nr:MAG: (d)CMP kinase [Clostridiales bacterium]
MYSVAIDGPSGSGKSTLAKTLSKKLGWLYIDTGAMYRTVGLYAKRNQIEPNDEKSLQKHFSKIDIKLEWIDGSQHVFLNGEDVSDKIRTPEMSMYASAVSALPAVRAFLLEKQRDFARNNNVIMDGRDIGTVVLPDAQVKIFLKAGNEERARRRYEELIAKGQDVKFEDVLDDMLKRDKNDSTRAAAPCVPAHDAVLLDNSGYEPETTERKAMEIINAKLGTKF